MNQVTRTPVTQQIKKSTKIAIEKNSLESSAKINLEKLRFAIITKVFLFITTKLKEKNKIES